MCLLIRLTLLMALVSEVWTQETLLATDFMTTDCVESLARLSLGATYFLNKYVWFFALDQNHGAFEVTSKLSTQCGYTITSDFWGNIEFRASIISCYSKIVDDQSFSVMVQIYVSMTPDMAAAESYNQTVTCSYPWLAREIVCETNYMEVSVSRKMQYEPGFLGDQPEDWAAAYPEAASAAGSVWQIVFHLPSERKVMPINTAEDAGYGIELTDSRVVLRTSYNATETTIINVDNVDFSILRSTTFYKQRWMIFMVDTAVACPVDGIKYTDDAIIWHVPKDIPPLSVGANNIQTMNTRFGIDLKTLSTGDLRNQYVIQNDSQATTVEIPLGATSGYYKSHVVNGDYGITYSINLFLQNQWTDDKWGVTRHTIIRDITTPFMPRPPIVTDGTIPFTEIFNVTVGTFLQDVELVFITIGTINFTGGEDPQEYIVSKFIFPNGNSSYEINVPFVDPMVKVQVTGPLKEYTLNAVLGFQVMPENQFFTVPVVTVATLKDAVLPSAVGSCDAYFLNLLVTRGNVDQDWQPYIGVIPLTLQSGNLVFDNDTHYKIAVPRASSLASFVESDYTLVITLPVVLKDLAGVVRSQFNISCSYFSRDTIDCLPNGTIAITVSRKAAITGMDVKQLVLRDQSCRPTETTDLNVTFVFNPNTCGTTTKFIQGSMIYENDVFYFQSGVSGALYNMKVSCNYSIAEVVVPFTAENNLSPVDQHGFGSLALVMRLSKDQSYSDFYNDAEYPVVKFLQQPLYFEVELLYTQDVQLELFLEHCWATPSADRSSTPQWDVVINSCENTADGYRTIFHPVTADSRVRIPSHLKRLEVKTFVFREYAKGQVYFHCSVVICNAALPSSDQLCSKLCIPDKQRVGRSVSTNQDLHGYVSSGMVHLIAENITVEKTTKAH